jgi:hypothetical protein
MRSRIVIGLVVLLAVAGAVAVNLRPTGARAQTSSPNDYLFSRDFSSVQSGPWSYLQWNGSAYSPMAWDTSRGAWRGDCTYCIIARTYIHPDTNDSVIAWTAPKAGNIVIRGTIDHTTYTTASDGVRAVIRQRSGSTVAKIWPSADYQVVQPFFAAQHIVQTHVNTGDTIYFHLNRNATTSTDTSRWDPRISYGDEPQYTLDQAELVMTPADFDRVGITPALDSSLSAVANGSNVDFYHSGADTIQKFRGTLPRPATTAVSGSHFTNPHNLDGRWWIENLYRTASGHLLAFCHIENGDAATTGFWAGGLAYSTDGGKTFVKLGKTLSIPDKADINLAGMPYTVNNGYFYVYFNDNGVDVARAPVDEVINAAEAGTVTAWSKYADGAWTAPGLGGAATPVIPPDATDYYMAHGDAAYSTYLGKYLLTGYSHGPGKGTYLTFSDNGTAFEVPSWMQKSELPGQDTLSPYESIVNLDGTDNGVVGRSFYVYYGYRYKATVSSESQYPAEWRWLYRQKVTLNRAGFDRDSTDASTAFGFKQGGEQWRYQQFDGTKYTELSWDLGTLRWTGGTGAAIAGPTQVSASGVESVRTWIAPSAGTVHVTAPDGLTAPSGAQVRLIKNGTPLWQATLGSGTTPFAPLDVAVNKGDGLRFQVGNGTTTWAPVIVYAGAGRPTYLADADFSDTQGANQWSYAEWDGTAYTPMTWDASAHRWAGSATYLMVDGTVEHPDAGRDAVREWTAPKAGTVTLGLAGADAISVATGSGADGVKVKVMKNGTNLWPASGYQSIAAGSSVPFAALNVDVAAGDTLFFHVNQNVSTAYDSTDWVPAVTYK